MAEFMEAASAPVHDKNTVPGGDEVRAKLQALGIGPQIVDIACCLFTPPIKKPK